MPFCSQCGKHVSDADLFCASCGARQPAAGAPRARDPFAGMSPRTASILCYVPFFGWIGAIVVLASARFRDNRTVRFHAFQALYLFVAWLIVDQALGPMFRALPHPPGLHIDKILNMVLFGISIFMLIKASHNEAYSLPVIGELAEKSASER